MTTVERARRLASERPDRPVPCPECAAQVKGANLERHLAKTHDGAVGAHEARWGGPERVGSRWLLVLVLAAATGAAVYTATSGDPDDRIILGAAAVASLAIVVWGAVAWGVPLFPGRLRVDESGAVLRHSFGLARRRLSSIDKVVIGTAMESRPSGNSGNDDSYASVDVRVGGYLQMRGGRRQITVHCPSAGGVRSTWAGWEQGKKRKRLDITLDPREFVALQLALWERGTLSPR
ncbi:hypothetical protein [Aeromicrobium sp. NPDC092404]|uniref:hypothetical protein n=1 Tax=Aeromicrobium sp. NPDC092404 TaxID=3154976 RepID=UPI003442FDD1